MVRLTGRDGDHAYCLKCFEGDGGCPDMDTSKCSMCEHALAIYQRLAAYEDTGLTPAKVKELEDEAESMADEMHQLVRR